MRGGASVRRVASRAVLIAVPIALAALASAAPVRAQVETESILAVEATPIGALPPLALPMPASRNHNYFAFRVQSGYRQGRDGGDLFSYAGGADLQWRGGSIFGLTAGYQVPDCEGDGLCEGHAFMGARARFNVITGGPTIAEFFGDYSATSTLGAEIGFGYAPEVAPGFDACTLDVGMPLSVAMLQSVRLVSFVMPSASMAVDCGEEFEKQSDIILSAGIGLQQIWFRGLDVYAGFQRIFRDGTGYQFGLSVMYVHLP